MPAENGLLVAKNPEEQPRRSRSNYSLRLAATYEMKARGIHYFLVGDDDFGADDFRGRSGGVGLDAGGALGLRHPDLR